MEQKEKIFKALKERLTQLISIAEKETLKRDIKEKEKTKIMISIKEKKNDSLILLQVAELFKSLGGMQERELLDKLEQFVSYGLSAVFGEEYTFCTKLGTEGRDMKVDFFVKTGGLESDVTGAKGGGVAEVVSILLQLFFVVALSGILAPFLLLDTAMVHLSERYHANMSSLLKELCEKMGIQIVLLAHAGEYGEFADKVYHFKQKEGKTVVEIQRRPPHE